MQQKLNGLHVTQSSSYKWIDNNDFLNKGDGNDNNRRSGIPEVENRVQILSDGL